MIELDGQDRPYSPAITNRLTRWIRSAPLPTALVFLFILLGELALGVFSKALAGVLPARPYSAPDIYEFFISSIFVVGVLWFNFFMDREILEAFDNSKALFTGPEEEFQELRYRFAVLPLLPEILVAVISGVVAVAAGIEEYGFSDLVPGVPELLVNWTLPAVLTFVFAFRVARTIFLMAEFYTRDLNINLFNIPPIYELSSMAAKAGIFLVILWYPNSALELDRPVADDLFRVSVATLVGAIPLASFLIPMAILNRRLSAEKARLLTKASLQLEAAFKQVEERFEQGQLAEMANLESGIANLIAQKNYVESIPTWPWGQGTFRIALSAVMLPVIVWLIQQILDRLIGF